MKNNFIIKNFFITTNKIKRVLDKNHQKNDLYIGQARILSFLYRNKDEKIYQKDLEETFQVRGGTVTGMLDNLVKMKLLNRVESSTDKRKRKLILTKLGEEKALRAIETINMFEENISNTLTEEELVYLNNIFIKINNYLDMEETIWSHYLNI